jgi:hypothetical protein
VSPKDRRRFEDMAKQLFPDLARGCRAFLRHKDVLMSPRVLRSYNIQVVQARARIVPLTARLTVQSLCSSATAARQHWTSPHAHRLEGADDVGHWSGTSPSVL